MKGPLEHHRAWRLCWVLALAMTSTFVVSACSSTRACRQGSIFVAMTLEPLASAVDALEVDVTLDGVAQTALAIQPPTTGFTGTGSYEIDLTQYQRYTTVSIVVIARDGLGGELGRGILEPTKLASGCTAVSVVIRSPSGAGGAGGGRIGSGGSGAGGSAGAGSGGMALGGVGGSETTATGGASNVGGKGGGGAISGSGGITSGSGGITAVGGKGGAVASGGTGGASTCTSNGTGVVALLGCPCSAPGSLACNGNAQAVTLICSGGTWTHNQTCMAGNLCDSRMGISAGTCQPIVPACASATPGQPYCDAATSIARCGPDLVSDTPVQSCTGTTPACLNGACVACKPTSTQACGVCNDGTAVCNSTGTWGMCTGGSSKITYYRDADGDGYGDPKTTVSVCGAAPSGYVSSNTDCCDADVNAHPGQTAFFAAADACGSSQVPDGFDYDCDGVDTLRYTNLNTVCTTVASTACGCTVCYCDSKNVCASSCNMSGTANPPCGTSFGSNGPENGPNCEMTGHGGPPSPQYCK